MSSWRADRRSAARKAGALALVLACAWILSASPARAAFTIQVDYLDADGRRQTRTGEDAAYVFDRRTQYRAPREDGKTYRDEEVTARAFPFASGRIKFSNIRAVEFEWRTEEGIEKLVLKFEMTTGVKLDMDAAGLEGAAHPTAPRVRFLSTAGMVVLPIDPLTPAALRKGRPSILRIEFPRNPDLRRPPPRP